MRSLDEFEKKIGYKFKNRNLLITALTHSSYANESRGGDQSYERLEFLGDSILGFVTAEYLCKASCCVSPTASSTAAAENAQAS